MSNVVLAADLPAHILENFSIEGIDIFANGTTYSYTSGTPGTHTVAPDVTVFEGADGEFWFELDGPFEAGMRFSVTFELEFDRGAYDPAVTAPNTATAMLANAVASYTDGDGDPQTAGLAAPEITYPEDDPVEGLSAALTTSVTRESTPVAGSIVREDDVILYTLVITNTGGTDITSLLVEAPLPAGVTFVQWVDGEALLTSAPGDNPLLWTIDLLQPTDSVTLSFEVSVDALGELNHRELEFFALVAGSRVQGDTYDQYAGGLRTEITVSPPDGAPVLADEVITYTFEVENVGGEDVTDIDVIVESITGDYTVVTADCTPIGGNISGDIGEWVVDLLEPGDTETLEYAIKVAPLAAGATAETYHAITHIRAEDVDFTKEFDHYQYGGQYAGDLQAKFYSLPGPSAVYAGQQITYTIEVKNAGDAALTDIPVYIAIPAGTTLLSATPGPAGGVTPATTELEWLILNLDPDETLVFTFVVLVQALPEGSTGRNIVATALVDDGEIGTITHTQSPAALAFEKSGDLEDEIVAEDDVITYTIEVTNEGGDSAYGVEIVDSLPEGLDYVVGSATASHPTDATGAGTPVGTVSCEVTATGVNRYDFTWTISELLPGETAEVSFQARVTALPASLGGRTFDNIALVNGAETDTVTYRQQGEGLDTEKSANPPSGLVEANDTILYTIRVENLGANPQFGVDIVDALPAGTAFDDTFDPIVKIDGDELELASELPADDADKEGLFTFDETDGVVTFVIGSLPAAAEAEATFRVKVLALDGTQQSTRDIVNIAEVQGVQTNPVTHTQALQEDLAAVKSALPADGAIVYARHADGTGTRITYSIEVTNTTAAAIADVEIKDTLPVGLTYVPGSMTAENAAQTVDGIDVEGEVDETGTEFSWLVESIPAGESVTVQFQADVGQLPADETEREFVNSALVNDISTNSVTHYQYAASDLKAQKSADPAPGEVEADDVITYTIEVENNGSSTETDLQVSDAIPAGTVYVEGSALLTIGSKDSDDVDYDDADGGSLTWVIAKLKAGEKAVLTFQAKVLPLPEGVDTRSIRNKAQVGEGGQALITNEVVHTMAAVVPEPDLFAVKSASPAPGAVKPGDKLTYTITVRNNTDAEMKGVKVLDAIPAGTTYVADSASSGGTYDATAKNVKWSVDIEPQKQVQLTFAVTVNAIASGQVSIKNQALYGPAGETDPDIATNEVVHTAKVDGGEPPVTPPTTAPVNPGGDINININGGNGGNGGNAVATANGGNATINGVSGSNGSGSIGGKDIPKTSEASALWAVILVMSSGAAIAAVVVALIIKKKRALN